nr:DNA-directed DNA polymerase [Tanacetum cinerariifolium]
MLFQAQAGEGAEVAAQAVSQHMPTPDQPQAHLSTPSRQQTSDPNAPVLEHGQSSDLNTAFFSQTHETDVGPFINVEDTPMGGTFHISPPRSTHAPSAGQPSGGEEDPITLTALSFVDMVGKLVKKVKALEVKLKTKKSKMVVSDSDQEDDGKQDVDLDALRALANAAVTIDSNIPSGSTSQIPAASPSVPTAGPPGASTVSPGTSVVPPDTFAIPPGASTVPGDSLSVPADVPSSVVHAGVSSKGKSLMVEEDIPVKARIFKQMEEDRLEEVLDSTMYYTEADWLNIMAQVEANASLSKTLLGDTVSEDNFPARMVALIKRKRQALVEKLAQERKNRPMTQAQQRAYMRQYVKNQSSDIYTTGWTMAYLKSFTDDQLKEEFEKIRKVQSNSQIQAFSSTLKRTGPVLEEPSSKRQKSTEAPIPSVPEVPHSPAVSSPLSSHTRRKSLGRKRIPKPKSTLLELDLDADAQTFIKVVVTEDSGDEVLLFGLLLLVGRFFLLLWVTLMLFIGDLQVLFDSHAWGKGSCVWQHQNVWEIRSWRLYTLSNVHVLETVSGEVLYMFVDVSYPLCIKLMEMMLTHKLEIDSDVVGNYMTTAKQLIQFIKNQLAAAQYADAAFYKDIALIYADFSRILVKTQSSRYVVPTGRVVVPTSSFADALLLMPKFASTIKSLLTNKDKLFELEKVPLNKNCSAMLLKKLPEKLGDLDKFLIPCDFLRIEVCHALADPGASINLMPSSIWKNLSLSELTPTRMALELADRSITRPKGVAEDVFVKVGKFHFPTDFVVVDFEADPRVPLILGRSFLRTGRALIDVYGEEITLRVNDESVTFNLNQTMRYSLTYDDNSVNRVDVIDIAYYKPAVQSQRQVNPKIHDVIKKEVIKLLDAGMIYPISDSPWVSPIHCVPKKGGMTVVANENNDLIPTRLVTGWRVCIDYRKLNDATRKDHFPLPFMDQMLERLAGNEFYCFLDGFSGYFQILIDPQDQEKKTFTCPYGTFAYRRMPFGLCNAPGTFQRDSFSLCLSNLDKMLKCYEDTNLVLNWEKCHFMCKEGIVLGHKISKFGIEVDRAKVDVIAKLPHPTTVKGRKTKHFQPIHYASKTMTEAQIHYTTTEKEMLAVVYAFEKFRPYLVLSKSLVYTDHSTLKYLLSKQDAKPRLLWWVLLLQKFDITIRDKKGSENLTVDHLSRLKNPHKDMLENKDINENFPLETLANLSSGSTLWFADIANFHAGNLSRRG